MGQPGLGAHHRAGGMQLAAGGGGQDQALPARPAAPTPELAASH